jgi:hypothetical protein
MMERTKSFIKSKFPRSREIYRRFNPVPQDQDDLAGIFSAIYKDNSWKNQESVSGRGSTLERIDAACGDLNWMRHVSLQDIHYTGIDIVSDLIERNTRAYANSNRYFIALDITHDPLPRADVILCRDCFIHLSSECIHDAIANFKASNAVYLLATTHIAVEENLEIRSGKWRSVNLQLSPYNFPPPMQQITEDSVAGKCLGLWELARL